jgi:23S rRNA (cytosine1962-C5)-methyltransferase
MPDEPLAARLERALAARLPSLDPEHRSALRLFNGFAEGCPDLAVDLYARTLVLHDYAATPGAGLALVREAEAFFQERLPWLGCALVKTRNSPDPAERRGKLLFGAPDDRVCENGVWYALDLLLNRDLSLYLDTRGLRRWAQENLGGRSVLNTFAYTGSLGVAALAGGAKRVVQLDRSRAFLDLAKRSYALNGFPVHAQDFLVADFFAGAARLKRSGERFDCAIVDPPFFSAGTGGTVDLNRDGARLLNKVRPLIDDGGLLVAINNALYVSGREYLAALEALCADGYLKIRELVPVPQDFTGSPETRNRVSITDPAPFHHSTKIAVLDVRRKQEQRNE